MQAASDWTPPDPLADVTALDLDRVQEAIKAGRGSSGEGWRENVQAGEAWAGHAVAGVLGLDLTRPWDRARAQSLLRTWKQNGALQKVDKAVNAKGKTAPFLEVARWAEL